MSDEPEPTRNHACLVPTLVTLFVRVPAVLMLLVVLAAAVAVIVTAR
jgi:hypothetical protein